MIKSRGGQLLLELILSIAIGAVVLGIGGGLVYSGLRGNKTAVDKDIALGLADGALAAVRAVGYEKWQTLNGVTKNSNYAPSKDSDSGVSYKWVLQQNGATGAGSSLAVTSLSADAFNDVWLASSAVAGYVKQWDGDVWVSH